MFKKYLAHVCKINREPANGNRLVRVFGMSKNVGNGTSVMPDELCSLNYA